MLVKGGTGVHCEEQYVLHSVQDILFVIMTFWNNIVNVAVKAQVPSKTRASAVVFSRIHANSV